MKYVLLIAGLFLASVAYAQNTTADKQLPEIYSYTEQMPEPGDGLNKYLSENLHYPDSARELGIEGKVFLKFVVNENGGITDCYVLKGIGGGCDEEALRVGKGMPAWKPGKKDGVAVKVWTSFPIQFRLDKREIIYNTSIDKIEKLPKPDYDFDKYVTEHLQYPRSAWNEKLQGTVTLLCLVEIDGAVSLTMFNKQLSEDCDEEAKDLIRKMPNWLPAVNNGVPVRAWTPISIRFVFSENAKIADTVKVAKETPPSYGYDMNRYLEKNMTYPDYAREHNIQGRVILKFVVNEDGHISDAVVIRGIGGGCDEEAKRVVLNMPAWRPARQNGKPVKVSFTLPIQFKLTN